MRTERSLIFVSFLLTVIVLGCVAFPLLPFSTQLSGLVYGQTGGSEPFIQLTVSGVSYSVGQPANSPIGGHVSIEGSRFLPSDIINGATCSVSSPTSGSVITSAACSFFKAPSGFVNVTGSFTVGNVAEGEYVIQVTGNSEGDFAQAVVIVAPGVSLCQTITVSSDYPHQASSSERVQVATSVAGSCNSGDYFLTVRVDLVGAANASNPILSSNSTAIGYNANKFSVNVENLVITPTSNQSWPIDVNTYLAVSLSGSSSTYFTYLLKTTTITILVGGQVATTTAPTAPSISLNPPLYGSAGFTVEVSGSGFSSLDTNCSMSGSVVASSTCSVYSKGYLAGYFVVASVPAGPYTVTVTGSPLGDSASATLIVGYTGIQLNPTKGAVGSTVQVYVYGLSTSDTSCSLSGTAIASQTCSVSNGILTGSFVVANVPDGSYWIYATGGPTGDSASYPFTVSTVSGSAASLTFNPSTAEVGSAVDFSGSGLSAVDDTSCSLSGAIVASWTCSISQGTYTGSFVVAHLQPGSYTLTVIGWPVGDFASASFTVNRVAVTPTITLIPSAAQVGATVQVTGSGFSTPDTSCSLSGGAVGSQSCTISDGILAGTFTVATNAPGTYYITATGSPTGDTASASFSVTSGPFIQLRGVSGGFVSRGQIASGPVGIQVSISGSNFLARDALNGATCSISSPTSAAIIQGAGCSFIKTPTGLVNVTGSFIVGKVNLDQYVIQVSDSAGDSAQAVFNVASGPVITLTPTNGEAGTYIAVSGSAFLPIDNFCTISSPGTNAVLAGTASCAINSSSGVVSGSFTIGNVVPGQYVIIATGIMGDFGQAVLTVSISTQTSTTTTAITTATTVVSGMHVTLQLSTTDANGKPTSSFTSGGTMLVQAILINDGSVPLNNAYLLVSIYDSNNLPIFTGLAFASLNVGQETKISLGPTLPATAVTGTYLVQAVVLTAFLNAGGVPVPGGAGAVTVTVN